MFEVEWCGHKIGWEFVPRKNRAYLVYGERLFLDSEFLAEKTGNFSPVETLKTEFIHEDRSVPVESSVRAGLLGALVKLKIDGELVQKRYLPFWINDKWLLSLAANLILGFIAGAVAVVLFFFIMFNAMISITPFQLSKIRTLDTTKLPGKIYFGDTLGNLMTYTPATDELDTLLKTDSMIVRSISPDGKSVILVHPRGYKMREYPKRKVYWMTLEDGEMRFITEKKMESYYASFTPNGERVYFAINERFPQQYIVADTTGELVVLDAKYLVPNPDGTKFVGSRGSNKPWKIFDANIRETTVLNAMVCPLSGWKDWWNGDTIVSYKYRLKKQYLLFADYRRGTIDTVFYPFNWSIRAFGFPVRRVVANDYLATFNIIPPFFKNKFWIYEKDKLLWKTWIKNDGYVTRFSPDLSAIVVRNFSCGKEVCTYRYHLVGPGGRIKTIPIEGYILNWLDL